MDANVYLVYLEWGQDVEVLYGAIHAKNSKHWIGMEIDLKKGTITVYDCGPPDKNVDISHVGHLAVLIHALMMEAFGGKVNIEKVVPFQVEKLENLPKTNLRSSCGFFVLKMLECRSLKIEDMSKINDENALELRRSLSCKIFNQFVDENFGQ